MPMEKQDVHFVEVQCENHNSKEMSNTCEKSGCDKPLFDCKCTCLFRKRFCETHYHDIVDRSNRTNVVIKAAALDRLNRKLNKVTKDMQEIQNFIHTMKMEHVSPSQR